ncbi:hypothetical protein [Thermococcus sp.]
MVELLEVCEELDTVWVVELEEIHPEATTAPKSRSRRINAFPLIFTTWTFCPRKDCPRVFKVVG